MFRCTLVLAGFLTTTLLPADSRDVEPLEEPRRMSEEPPKPEVDERLARESAFAAPAETQSDDQVSDREVRNRRAVGYAEVRSLLRRVAWPRWDTVQQLLRPFSRWLQPILKDFGGHGLMSAAMHKGTLYGSYSWGSGLHRSHLFSLTIADAKPKLRETGGFASKDLFVSVGKDGTLAVQSGGFQAFNKWKNVADFGVLSIVEKELRVVDANGENVALEIAQRTTSDKKR